LSAGRQFFSSVFTLYSGLENGQKGNEPFCIFLLRYTPSAKKGKKGTSMTPDDILLEAEEKMIKTEQVVLNEFAGVRTGKASASLVENIMVEVYGSQMRLRELAGITTPEPRMLVVQPWDLNSLHPIEKAIQKSNIGLNPTIQGKIIRLAFPELSQERRQEFVKLIKKMAEDGRVAIRHVRRDAMEQLKKHAHDSGITEDQEKQAEKDLQKLTDQYSAKIDGHVGHKEKEIMTV
jgi:ribosome recycling factor